ncbi:MAG TPA: antibiotic biosynthesis monooxygenase [Reyranella sp.]
MLTITAVIRAHKGEEGAMRRALLEVADNVRAIEPDTAGFFISQDLEDPCVFTTYERFTDRAAMDRHNGSAAVAKFFGIAKPLLDGAVTLVTSSEISAKG